jgi:tetratricopeptide (TPR) repeat protein
MGDANAALELVNTLPEIHRDSALRYVAAAQAKNGSLDSAAETAAMIRHPIYRGEASQRIATAYADQADFRAAQQIVSGISEASAQALAWTTIAVRQLRSGERAAAEETLSRAIKATGQIPNDSTKRSDRKSVVMAEIAGVQAEFGNIEAAKQTAQQITQAPWHDLAWGNIATAQANRGATQAALHTADSIKEGYYRGQAVTAIAAACAERGDFAEARELADSITSNYWRLSAFVGLAKSQIRAGQRAAATRLLERVLREAGRVKDDETLAVRGLKGAVLYQLARVQSQAGDWKAASEWIAKQSSNDIRALAYVGLAEGLATPEPDKLRPE